MTQFDFVWRSLRGLGVPSADADDAAQHVFWIAAQKLDAIDVGRERAFLFSTCRGVAANVRRSVMRRRERPEDDNVLADRADPSSNPESALEAARARARLEELLEDMPNDLRTVFVLFELEELTTQAIAEVLEIPAGTVASRLRRARAEFKMRAARMSKADES